MGRHDKPLEAYLTKDIANELILRIRALGGEQHLSNQQVWDLLDLLYDEALKRIRERKDITHE
jgi:hypothetical protein